ncbi:unnamed protein product [Orchesella dallaii]|uniref:Carbohydrate sulfotransferase n=1 Tax=Orchesella dallaii TaxID=48710 RepID=A0ABP1RER0_9HEXA
MHNQLRKIRFAIRKQSCKSIIGVLSFVSALILLIITFYDECHQFGVLPLSVVPENCKRNVVVKERLDATAISSNILAVGPTSLRGRKGNESLDLMKGVLLHLEELHDEENDSQEVPDSVFEERKIEAERACMDMLNAEMYKESNGDNEDEKLLANDSMLFRRVLHKSMYNRNLLQFGKKFRNKMGSNKIKYFQTSVAGKKNRWINFHRVIKSEVPPMKSRVVEIKWCPVFKAASTPFLAVFTKLSNFLTNKTEAQIKRGKLGFMDLARIARLLTPRIYEKSLHVTKYTMVVVRHPFKRLLSAYRDKIERVKGRLYYYKKYSTKIIARFRKSELGAVERSSKDRDYSLKVPTFQEFVHYVLSTDPRKLDEHWRPIFLDCNPCHRTFDFILKVETLDDDKQKVLHSLRLSQSDPQYKEVEDVWIRWNNPSGGNEPKKNESFYYSQLSLRDMEKLYDLYEPDFRIFDYSPDPYVYMVKDADSD